MQIIALISARSTSRSRGRLVHAFSLSSLLLALCLPVMLAPAFAATDATPGEWMEAGAEGFRLGDFRQALENWKRAAAAYEAAGNREDQVLALVRTAEAYLALGRYPDALGELQGALSLAKEMDHTGLVARVESSLGNTLALSGRSAQAEERLKSSIELATQAENPQIAASALNNLGNLLASQDKFDEAVHRYRQAVEAAAKAGNDNIALRARINLARALVDDGRYAEAAILLADAQKNTSVLQPTHDKAYGLISIGRLNARLSAITDPANGAWKERALEALNEALTTADAIKDQRARSYALGYLGAIYEEAGRHEESLQYTQRAIFAARRADAPEALYRWQWQTGRVLKAQGHTKEAILAYQNAVYTLQTIRRDLAVGYGGARESFRQSLGPLFFELADLLLQRAASETDPQQATQSLVAARETVELLKGAELEDYFEDDCVAALKAKTTGIDELAARTAAVYPIILNDRTELLVSLPDGLRRFTTQVDAHTLTEEVRAFRRRLEKRTLHQYLPHAEQLYAWTIQPIEPELKRQNVETLVIVPDGPLRTIPMAALYDGSQFLAARFAIATTPGLTLTDPRPIQRETVRLLINGLTESVQGFPALPYVAEEIQTVETLYGGTTLVNESFVAPKMEKVLKEKNYSIVHVASHGQFDSDISKTFLLTHDDKLSMDALEKLLALTRFREQPVELLTLSACQTAAGDDRAALGLAGVAVKAGARSALATLWTVNDPASALLVSEFYRQLQDPSVSKAKALQQAQLKLLQDRRYGHPGYWSPFLLIGNWL